MEHLPEEIYLTKVGDITFLCIKDAHMWPVSSIRHVDMQLSPGSTIIQFDGNQSWTFKEVESEKVKRLLNENYRIESSLASRMQE